MKRIGPYLCATYKELIDVGVKPHEVKNAVKRGKWSRLADPDCPSDNLYPIDNLPQDVRAALTSQQSLFAAQEQDERITVQLVTRSTLAAAVKEDPELLPAVTQHVAGYNTLHQNVVRDILRGAAWLAFLMAARPADFGFATKPEMMAAAAKAIASEKLSCLKVKGEEYLRKKVTEYKASGWQCLVSRKYGNANRAKMNPEQLSLLRTLFGDGRKFSIAQVAAQYNMVASEEGWEKVTRQAVNKYLSRPEIQSQIWLTRHGRTRDADLWADRFDPITHRERPRYPNDVWVLDGTPMELWDKNGKRLYGFLVVDAYSWKVVGFATGQTETSALVFEALRRACKSTGALPYQIIIDNGSALKAGASMDFFARLALHVTPAAVGNARTKIAEPVIKHIREQVFRYEYNHSGGNITAKSLGSKVNQEYVDAHKHLFPEHDALVMQVEKAIACWNHLSVKGGPTPSELQAERSPRHRQLEPFMEADLFWLWRKQGERFLPYTCTNEGVEVNWQDGKRWYRAPAGGSELDQALWFTKHYTMQFNVKYDPHNRDVIMLYADGRFVAFAEVEKLTKMSLVDFEPGDGALLAFREKTRKLTREIATEMAEVDAQVAAQYIKGGITFERMHKDAWNRAEADLKQFERMGYLTPPLPPVRQQDAVDLYGSTGSDHLTEV